MAAGLVSELSPLRERESGVVREGGKSTSGLEPIPGAPIALALGAFQPLPPSLFDLIPVFWGSPVCTQSQAVSVLV